MYILFVTPDGVLDGVRLVSNNSLEYSEYLMARYIKLKEGTKKECMLYWEELERESSDTIDLSGVDELNYAEVDDDEVDDIMY